MRNSEEFGDVQALKAASWEACHRPCLSDSGRLPFGLQPARQHPETPAPFPPQSLNRAMGITPTGSPTRPAGIRTGDRAGLHRELRTQPRPRGVLAAPGRS